MLFQTSRPDRRFAFIALSFTGVVAHRGTDQAPTLPAWSLPRTRRQTVCPGSALYAASVAVVVSHVPAAPSTVR